MKNFFHSFIYAFNGIKILLLEERNARIHFIALIIVIFAGFYFSISKQEWLVLILTSGLVISLEAMNTVIENLADFVSPEKHEAIKRIKDISAAAVLVAAITSLIIGVMIFIPKIVSHA